MAESFGEHLGTSVRGWRRRVTTHPAAYWTRWQLVKLRHRLGRGTPNEEERFDAAFAPPEASAWRKKYFTLAERLIPPGASVLEVGCGAGGMLRHLQSQGRKVLGVDFARATVDGLVASGVPAEVHDLRSDAPLPTGYDVVLCLEVMEHFSDPWAIYDKLWAAAGQRVVFSVPDRYMVPDDDHLYEFTYADVAHRLAPRGPVTFMGGHRCYIVAAQDKP
ncbi:MAG: class I SAM-dependent methyltransferase [Bradymonadia bacterium]|jgi:2-polyprenyl-3-methyl-5-hydroxy-6-metoxy-1,4-benzoquinol methylase